MKRLTVEVDDRIFAFLKGLASFKNISLRLQVTRILRDFIKEQEDLGFKVPSIPPDKEKGE